MANFLIQFLVAVPIAIVLGIGLFAIFALLLVINRRISIRMERPPISTVREYFAAQYPNHSISWLRLTATETSRSVVGVFYGGSRPPRHKFFAVAHDTQDVTELDNCRKYAPKNWR